MRKRAIEYKFKVGSRATLQYTILDDTGAVKDLKQLSQAIQNVKSSIEDEDVEKTIENFNPFIDTSRCGTQMIEQFFEQHRDIRLWKIRLKDRGLFYLQDNKQKMLNLFDDIEVVTTKQLRSEITPN